MGNCAVEDPIKENGNEDDAIVCKDGSVKKKGTSLAGPSLLGETGAEVTGAVKLTTARMVLEIKAITGAFKCSRLDSLQGRYDEYSPENTN